ncbi:sulfatase-like hydrolase/transferase [Winogradskyella flava]|uniref:Sulfatase-like hydrolase/transferase n=1 Tax=Winogradskyella flava TaxID=1884876 RepID=A0A842IMK9_9FLAO|nr:sulfatase-like hydrolase/transferase [Winogradskyella flava]MBC2843971.1 sulfatase-like hydrolase/transferase [Winogradskyella flava]
MKIQQLRIVIIAFALIFSCNSSDDSGTQEENPESSKPNILLIIADDMGLDATPGYTIGSIKPNMPNLQELINSGIRFTNLWSNPVCTPTRGTILTGKYGFRTGVLKVDDNMPTSEVSIQSHLDNTNSGYSHAVIGKWHLSNNVNHPTNMGVGYYAGLLNGGVQSYTNWNLTENGVTTSSNEYTTTKFTNLAIDWINEQNQPWFLWLAYNAPHTPFHLPPNNLHTQESLPNDQASVNANPLPYYMTMLEAMDSEMGRLFNSMTEVERNNTIIIFIGDNGTPGQVAQDYNSNRAKGSVYQGGVNVPMIISGKNVGRVNAIEDALITTTDLYATISELAGNTTQEINDSKSFKALLNSLNTNERNYIYTEIGSDNGNTTYTIRNATHKYIRFAGGNEAFYNLSNNPLENPNLLNANQLPLSAENSVIRDELLLELNNIQN